jgi:RimJ/RimL family protein N-acetyltransferase
VSPKIGSERLVFRRPAEGDVDRLTEMLAHPEVARWWPDYDRPRVAIELVGGDEDVRVIEHVGAGAEITLREIGECRSTRRSSRAAR